MDKYVLIPLTNNLVTAISPEDAVLVSNYMWNIAAFESTESREIRACTHLQQRRRKFMLHEMLLGIVSGETKLDKGYEIDHWNGYCLDNRRCNLRIIKHSNNIQNQTTKRKGKTSKYQGVCKKRESSFLNSIRFVSLIFSLIFLLSTASSSIKSGRVAGENFHNIFC